MTTRTTIKCSGCGTVTSVVCSFSYKNEGDDRMMVAAMNARGGKATYENYTVKCCGREPKMSEVRGVYRPAHKCDARCESSVGNKCECACGGKNHGAAFAA